MSRRKCPGAKVGAPSTALNYVLKSKIATKLLLLTFTMKNSNRCRIRNRRLTKPSRIVISNVEEAISYSKRRLDVDWSRQQLKKHEDETYLFVLKLVIFIFCFISLKNGHFADLLTTFLTKLLMFPRFNVFAVKISIKIKQKCPN